MNLIKFYMVPILCLASSCSQLLPKYHQPQVLLPSKWPSHSVQELRTKTNQLAWWENFHDPQLNKLIALALVQNNQIGMARGKILQAQALVKKAKVSVLPTLNLSGTGFTGRLSSSEIGEQIPGLTPASYGNNAPPRPLKFDGYVAGFVPSFSINILKQMKLHELAKYNLAVQDAIYMTAKQGICSSVAGNYFSLLGLKRQILLQQRLIQDAKQLRQYTAIQYQKGAISSIRLASLDQYIAMLQKEVPSLRYKMVTVQNALQVLINENPGPIITKNRFEKMVTTGNVPVHLPAEVLKSRPDIVIAENQLRMSHAAIGVASADLIPAIELTGVYGGASLALKTILSASNGFSLAVGQIIAGLPIFNPTLYAEITKAKGKKYTAYYNYIQTVRKALEEVDNALSKQSTGNESYKQIQMALNDATQQYKLAMRQYELGSISYAETFVYKLNMDYMATTLNKAKIKQILNVVMLYQVLGLNNYSDKA